VNGVVKNVANANGGAISAITSMVAGSVNRIAAIQSISGINISGSTILGADKMPTGGNPDYLDANGNPTSTNILGGKLIDGAIVGANISGLPLNSARVFNV